MSLRRGLVVFTLGLALAGCGGSSGGSGAAASPTPSPSPTIDPAAAKAEISTTWETFFKAAGSVDSHIALLEDGEKFRKELTASAADPANKDLAAHVTNVVVTGPNAAVTYDLLGKGGAALLNGAAGQAILVNGKWLVTKGTYCGLITLQDSTGTHPGCS